MAVPSVLVQSQFTQEQNIYRGEGNLCLVLSNIPERKVYRFFKVQCESEECADGVDRALQVSLPQFDTITRLQHAIDYVRCVIRPLLNAQFVPHMEIVELPKDFLNRASKEIQQLRPKSRLNKRVNVSEPYALSMCDMTLLPAGRGDDEQPTITVEIKPKCGFIPALSVAGADSGSDGGGGAERWARRQHIRSTTCKYCLLQRYKYKVGKVSTMSSYCPLQLFSGNQQLVSTAISHLFENPQNNLRLFKNGDLLDLERDREESLRQLLSVLYPNQGAGVAGVEKFRELLAAVLCKEVAPAGSGTILDKVLELQRLSQYDISTIYHFYLTLEQYYAKYPNQRLYDCLDGPFTSGEWQQQAAGAEAEAESGARPAAAVTGMRDVVREVRSFLLAQTLRDCQIMIAFQPTTATTASCSADAAAAASDSVIEFDGRRYIYHIGIIDLDPKPYHKIPVYYRQEDNIIDAYLAMEGDAQNKSCLANISNSNLSRHVH